MAAHLMRRSFICQQCHHHVRISQGGASARYFSGARDVEQPAPPGEHKERAPDQTQNVQNTNQEPELGPMARRLQEATEEALLTGGIAGRRAVEDAGFSDELKAKLLDKVADAKFREQFSGAFAEAGLPASADAGMRNIATAQPWSGQESTHDAVLRMLDDAKKSLKPGMRGKYQPPPVDMRLKREPVMKPGQRAVAARDKAAMYTDMGIKRSEGLSDKEREELKKEYRERFQSAARSLPNTISGLTALANERIEDAIARGQFKDLPRGRAMKRDPRADNPFIDTTEYILNKMIQRQDIVPPWIEKQQELVKAARVFRTRIRNDWKRHAARMIASEGGSLQEQMRKAEAYAAAELVHNPRLGSSDQIPVPSSSTDDPVMVRMRQQAHEAAKARAKAEATVVAAATAAADIEVEGSDSNKANEMEPPPMLVLRPYRDAAWEKAEHAYMALSIDNINSIARSYNLMAPDLAKKPYFLLQRELVACFADVAPLVAGEIRERATGRRTTGVGATTRQAKKSTGIMSHFKHDNRGSTRIYPEMRGEPYGLRELWRDLWKNFK